MTGKVLYPLVAVAALLAGIATQHWWASPTEPVPEPPLHDLAGTPHSLAEWRGKVVVLNFWATWCPPCREEMPEFSRLQQELGGQGLQFVGAAIDDPEEVRTFLKDNPINYPILLGDERVQHWADQLGNHLSVLPFSVVFDRTGQPVATHTGGFERQQVLDIVRPLLETRP